MTQARLYEPVRLISAAGAAVALNPIPDVTSLQLSATAGTLVDVEILSPDRLVRYLGRRLTHGTAHALADAFLAAAIDNFPEQTVATVDDQEAGLAIGFVESTPFTVALEVLIRPDLDDDVPEHDGVVFDVLRASLVTAAHTLLAWSATNTTGGLK